MSSIIDPIKRTVFEKEKLGWHISIREIPHQQGYSYPVFEWSYGHEEGIRGGEVRMLPLQNLLIFKDRRGITLQGDECRGCVVDWENEIIKFQPDQSEILLRLLTASYGWGEPPHFREALESMAEAQKMLLLSNPREFGAIFSELKDTWSKMVSAS